MSLLRTALLASCIAAPVVLSGCDTTSPADNLVEGPTERDGFVPLIVSAETARAGERLTVRLANGTDLGVGYNLCFAYIELDRQTDAGWERTLADLSPNEQACTAELRILSSGRAVEAAAYLPRTLPAGVYRLATEVEVGVEVQGPRQRIATEPFEVRR